MHIRGYCSFTFASLLVAAMATSLTVTSAKAASLLATENTTPPGTGDTTKNVNVYRVRIDGGTCSATLLDSREQSVAQTTDNFNGNAFEPQSCRFYYSRFDRVNLAGTEPNPFFFYDLLSGETQQVQDLQFGSAGAAIYNNEYYYIPQRTTELRKVSLNPDGTKGDEVSVCSISLPGTSTLGFGDITFDPFDQSDPPTLYGSATRIGGSPAFEPQFFKIQDLDCGTYEVISTDDEFGAGALQIAFGLSDGILYGHSARSGTFYTINTETGAQTKACDAIDKNSASVSPTGDFGGIDPNLLKFSDLTEGQCSKQVFDGCTPGYWKQDKHLDSWEQTDYFQSDLFEAVFGVMVIDTDLSGITLQDALKVGGGGEKALLRHATAALLNASSADVDYPYEPGVVIRLVQAAYDTGEFEEAKNVFESKNESICPLN